MHDDLHKYIVSNIKIPKEAYTYGFSTNGGPEFPVVMAKHIEKWFQPSRLVKPEEILTCSALTSLHEAVALSLGDEGDGKFRWLLTYTFLETPEKSYHKVCTRR